MLQKSLIYQGLYTIQETTLLKQSFSLTEPSDEEIGQWWNWLLEKPRGLNPLIDKKYVPQGQTKSTWCILCTGGGIDPEVREFDTSGGSKDVLVPVFVAAYTSPEAEYFSQLSGGKTVERLKAAIDSIYPPDSKVLEIDGNVIDPYLKFTGPFNVNVPADNILLLKANDERQQQEGVYETYSAGYWAKINFTDPGHSHKIVFGGKKGDFETRVIYNILT